MTTIKSGWFPTPTNTPTGTAKKIAVDNPYITKDDFINSAIAIGLGIDDQHQLYKSGELQRMILRASGEVNRHCRRYFDTQTIDETKSSFSVRPYNPQLVSVVLNNRPYQSVNSIYIQVLKWFIQVDTTPGSGYLQDFPDLGYYRIVPLLSTAGTGAGSPMPAQIVDKTPLGVLWTNYTFGFGTVLTTQSLSVADGTTYKAYQAILGNRLWAPDQTFHVYKNSVLQASSLYTVDYPNGIVTFTSALINTDVVTVDFTTNESVPFDIKQATTMLVGHYLQFLSNPLGARSISMQTFSASWGDKSGVFQEVERILIPYENNMPMVIS